MQQNIRDYGAPRAAGAAAGGETGRPAGDWQTISRDASGDRPLAGAVLLVLWAQKEIKQSQIHRLELKRRIVPQI